jgi:small subunit ribosomal protein S3
VGQKTHPLGFRLGITQKHKSVWFTNLSQYADFLKEDYKIRDCFKPLVKIASICDIKINRNNLGNLIELNVETARPGVLVGKNGEKLKSLINIIKAKLPRNRKIKFTVNEIVEKNFNAALIADYIAEQLEKRMSFRRILRQAIEEIKIKDTNGIKIQISGRLNGAEMARREWIREGRVPLQTLRAIIDYSNKEAHTIYGVFGIKVWLFKNEVFN